MERAIRGAKKYMKMVSLVRGRIELKIVDNIGVVITAIDVRD